MESKKAETPEPKAQKDVVPIWLKAMLSSVFYEACTLHYDAKKKELNYFCVDCCSAMCSLCIQDHSTHRYIQIRKYIYKNVVNLQDIRQLFNCTGIQAFTTNGSRVVFLTEKPTSQNKLRSCNAVKDCIRCERSLQDPSQNYCSLACKVNEIEARTSSKSDENWNTRRLPSVLRIKNPSKPSLSELANAKDKPKRMKRKGTPKRSPLS